MKKSKFLIVPASLLALMLMTVGCDKWVDPQTPPGTTTGTTTTGSTDGTTTPPINGLELPAGITAYLNTHFPGVSVVWVERDGYEHEHGHGNGNGYGGMEYEIRLSNGISLDFIVCQDGTARVMEISGHVKLPDSVIPAPILAYTQAHYADSYIIEWKLDDGGQQVELNTRLELHFDMNGNFIYVDYD